jgi:hypothetical protein
MAIDRQSNSSRFAIGARTEDRIRKKVFSAKAAAERGQVDPPVGGGPGST